MENYGLTHPKEGGVNPLRYYLTMIKHRLELHFTENGATVLSNLLQNQHERNLLPESFILPNRKNWGIHGVLTTKGQGLLPIRDSSAQRTFVVQIPINDKSKFDAVAESLSIIFSFDHFITRESVKKGYVHPGTPLQLFSIETQYTAEEKFHGASLSLSVSPNAAKFLKKHSPGTPIPRAHREMQNHWRSFSGKSKKEAHHLYGSFTAHLREYGMLSLSTLGSCACMGGIPEELPEGVGFSIDSHNVDCIRQQLNLLVGIACLWDWVRISLQKKAA